MIRLSIPSLDDSDYRAVQAVLETGFLVQGPAVAAFEQAMCNLVGTKHAIAVSNGTATLHLALLALGVQVGDLVITTAYSWLSTANVIELIGATPVFVDICPDTFNLDPAQLKITLDRLMSNKTTANRVKCIMPVHAFGHIADMPAILELANEYRIPVIEDAACALGASLNRVQAGAWGTLSSFSFHPRKAITTGEGGVVTTNDDELAWKIKAMRNHGLDPNSSTPNFVMPGFNYRLTEFQGALGLSQMQKLERIIKARQAAAAIYDQLLESTAFKKPEVKLGVHHVYQSYVCLLPASIVPKRKELIAELKSQGIETNIGTWHMPMTDYYAKRYGYQIGDFPVTDTVFFESFTLPLFEDIKLDQQQKVIHQLLQII
jgi:perosamine synthetase